MTRFLSLLTFLLALCAAPAAAQTSDPAARAQIQARLTAAYAEQNAAFAAVNRARAAAIGPEIVRLSCLLDGTQSPTCATATHNWGASLFWQERLPDAADQFERAAAIQLAIGGDSSASENFLADILTKLNAYDRLLALRQRQLPRVTARYGADSREAIDAQSQVGALLLRLRRYADVVPYRRRTWDWMLRHYGPNHPDTIDAANGMSFILFLVDQIDESGVFAERSLAGAIAHYGPTARETGKAWHSAGNLRKHRGQCDSAIDAFRSALVAIDASGEYYPGDRSIALVNLAECLEAGGRYAEAQPFREGAVRAAAPGDGNASGYRLDLARNLAAQGRYDDARPLAGAVLDQRLAAQKTPVYDAGILYARLSLAEIERGAGKPAAVREQVAAMRAMPGFSGWVTGGRIVTGGLDADADAAAGNFAAAEAGYRRLISDGADPASLRRFNTSLGQLLVRDPARRAEAVPYLRAAVAARASDPLTLPQGDSAVQRAAAAREADAGLLRAFADALWARGAGTDAARVAEAFTALQDSMAGKASRAVAEQAARTRADQSVAGLGAQARELQLIDDRLAATEALVIASLASDAPDAAANRARAEAAATALRGQRDALRARLRDLFPAYFALVRPDAVGLSTFQALLGADEAALMVVPSGDGTHIVAITRSAVSWHRSDWSEARVADAVRRLLWFAGADVEVSLFEAAEWKEQVPGLGAFDRKAAYDLYRALVAPAAPLIAGKRHLFVAGAGRLAKLPFSLLVSAPPTGSDNDPQALRTTHWFADDVALIHLPALQSLAALRGGGASSSANRPATPGFLGIGDPVLDGAPRRRVRRGADDVAAAGANWPVADNAMVDVAGLRRMARLPGTGDELAKVAARFPAGSARLLTGSGATETAVRGADLSRYGIISFATHGLMAGEVAGAREAGLVLTPPAAARPGDDGYLSVSDVSGLTLSADWVILSACNSAADDGSAGAVGMSGLARAFFYAGGRALLASHWPVLDDVAVDLVVETVTPGASPPGLSKAEALQRAMQQVRGNPALDTGGETMAHPSAWAPFVLIGDWR